jgi:hypothetical protein
MRPVNTSAVSMSLENTASTILVAEDTFVLISRDHAVARSIPSRSESNSLGPKIASRTSLVKWSCMQVVPQHPLTDLDHGYRGSAHSY